MTESNHPLCPPLTYRRHSTPYRKLLYFRHAWLVRRAHGPDASEAVHVVCIVRQPRCDSIAAPHQQDEPMRWVRCVALAWPLALRLGDLFEG
jgi:hypothetical protein